MNFWLVHHSLPMIRSIFAISGSASSPPTRPSHCIDSNHSSRDYHAPCLNRKTCSIRAEAYGGLHRLDSGRQAKPVPKSAPFDAPRRKYAHSLSGERYGLFQHRGILPKAGIESTPAYTCFDHRERLRQYRTGSGLGSVSSTPRLSWLLADSRRCTWQGATIETSESSSSDLSVSNLSHRAMPEVNGLMVSTVDSARCFCLFWRSARISGALLHALFVAICVYICVASQRIITVLPPGSAITRETLSANI